MSQLKVNKIAPLSGDSLTFVDSDGSTARITIDTSGHMGIGDTTPDALLDIQGGAAQGTSTLLVDHDDEDQIGVVFNIGSTTAVGMDINLSNTTGVGIDIDSSNTTANVIDVTADSLTTGWAMSITADALTSGRLMYLHSNSSDSSSRYLVWLHNDHTSATGTLPLFVQQDAVACAMRVRTSTASFTEPLLEIENMASDSQGPILRLKKNGNTPAAGDECGEISFYSEDSANNLHEYGNIQCIAVDETSGSEEGALVFSVAENDGTLTQGMRIIGSPSVDAHVATQITSAGNHPDAVTYAPLQVYNNSGTTYAATFKNDGDASGRKGLLIAVGADSPTSQADCVYMQFTDGNGGGGGGIQCGSTVANPEFFNGSDERIKRDIAPTQVIGLDVINALEMKEFRWKSDFCKYDGLNRIGFIAQNCEQAYPEMVSESPDENFDFDIKSVSKGELIPVLVKAVQELSAKVNQLEAQLSG